MLVRQSSNLPTLGWPGCLASLSGRTHMRCVERSLARFGATLHVPVCRLLRTLQSCPALPYLASHPLCAPQFDVLLHGSHAQCLSATQQGVKQLSDQQQTSNLANSVSRQKRYQTREHHAAGGNAMVSTAGNFAGRESVLHSS